jgi:salicylate hydroxylase
MLQPTGLAVLRALRLDTAIVACGRRIDRLVGRTVGSQRLVLDVRYEALGGGVAACAVHRSALFGALFDAALAAGVEFRPSFEVAGLERRPCGRPVLISVDGDRAGPFDLAIDALGARSPLREGGVNAYRSRPLAFGALWANLPWPGDGFDPHALEQRYLGSTS